MIKTKQKSLSSWVEALTIPWIALIAVVWVIAFGALYFILPLIEPSWGVLKTTSDGVAKGFPIALYVSVGSAVSLAFSDVYPTGVLRGVAVAEVIGGLIIIGLAVNALVSIPSRHARLALRAAKGWWGECVDLPKGRRFYTLSSITARGALLELHARNVDAGGRMDNTTYSAEIITTQFPTLIALYDNDSHSVDYTSGVYMITLQFDASNVCRQYEGHTYDAKHGKRDRMVGRKIVDPEIIKRLDNNSLMRADREALLHEMFHDLERDPTGEVPGPSTRRTTRRNKVSTAQPGA